MVSVYRAEFLAALVRPPRPGGAGPGPGLVGTLLMLCPATLPLGLLGALRALRAALVAEGDDPACVGGAFWLVWLAAAALAPACWPSGPRPVLALALLVPLNLLAARAVVELGSRRIPVRALVWLAPATALSVTWSLSTSLRAAAFDLVRWRGPDAATLLELHLGLDLVLLLTLATWRLDRWARPRDGRRRLVLAAFLLTVLGVNAATGLREVRFLHRETSDLLDLRTEILRRHRVKPFEVVAVVGGLDPAGQLGTPGGRLRFVLRSALPALAQCDLGTTAQLTRLPDRQRLVILVGREQQMPYKLQSQLGLEMIHPGRAGILNAFASTYEPPRKPKVRR